MQIAVQSSLPSGGPDSIKNLQPPGAVLLDGSNAAQITIALSGLKTLTPYWWSETSHAWIAAPNNYQLSASAPTASGVFSKVAEPQWWALLASGGGTVTQCNLDTTTITSSNDGVPTSRTITAGAGLSGGGNLSANRTISLAALDPSPASTFTAGVIKSVNQYGQIVEAEESTPSTSSSFWLGGGMLHSSYGGTFTLADYQVGATYPPWGNNAADRHLRVVTGGIKPAILYVSGYGSSGTLHLVVRRARVLEPGVTWVTIAELTLAMPSGDYYHDSVAIDPADLQNGDWVTVNSTDSFVGSLVWRMDT